MQEKERENSVPDVEAEPMSSDSDENPEEKGTPEDALNSTEDDGEQQKTEPESADEEFELRARQDLATLKALYPHLSGVDHLSRIDNAVRFAQLRDMGLSVEEAYMASSAASTRQSTRYDNRSHLKSFVPRTLSDAGEEMSRSELESAKEMFGNLSEKEIRSLYKRVKK